MAIIVPSAHADFTLNFDVEFSGATPPVGTPPWLTATFSQFDVDQVLLEIDLSGLTDDEYVSSLYFNLDPVFDPMDLSATYQSGALADLVSFGTNAFRADGDGYYDLVFEYPNAGPLRFSAGETSSYLFEGISGLTPESFAFIDFGGTKGDFFGAAHVQSINDDDSGWVGPGASPGTPVPEPATATMVLIGAGMVWARRRSLL